MVLMISDLTGGQGGIDVEEFAEWEADYGGGPSFCRIILGMKIKTRRQ